MPTYKTLRKPGRGEALPGKKLGAPARGFSAFPGPENAVDPEARVERAGLFGHHLGSFQAGGEKPAAPIQRVVRPGRKDKAGKYYSTETKKWYSSKSKAEREDAEAADLRRIEKQQKAERRKRLKEERIEQNVEPKDAVSPLDKMVQVAHNRPRDPKYARHSTTAVGIPLTYDGFGKPVISQQRNEKSTVKELSEKLTKSKLGLQEPEVIPSLESGQHADPFAVYKAFAGDFEKTGELPLSLLFGVSKGRCDDCDDALSDFPMVMDDDFLLGESTKKWNHAKRIDAQDEIVEDDL
ncbi:MAG TPA: hypothetical protein VJ725_29470 [Thermoanaerobaculia bacterium]|nr:hypothetical protein [Thermoanaerobaculia bacterium]